MTELVARLPLGSTGGLQRASRASAGALVLLLVAVGLVDALNSTTLSTPLAFAGGVALVAFLWVTIRHYETAIAIGLLLMGVVRFEPAPPDLAFALIMSVAAVTGRFRLNRVPSLLRWIVALLLVVNLASLIEVTSTSKALRFLFITVYLCIFAVWLTGFVDRPKHTRLVVVTWLAIGVFSAVVAALALHFPIPGRSFINGSVDKGERASGFFKDPNTFGPFLIPIAVILLEQHIARRAPRLLRLRAWSTWACLLALTIGILFSYSRAAWANYAIAIVVMLAASSMRRAGARRALRALGSLLLVGGITVVILSASGSIHFLEARAHAQSYDSARFAAQSFGWQLGWTHPLGVGPGQFESLSPVAAQSTYVRTFAEQGFLGLALWIVLVLSTLVLALRNAVIGRDTYGIGSAALLGVWCGLIFNSTVVDTLHWRHLWVVMALIWAAAARGRLSQPGGVWTALGLARPGLRRAGAGPRPRALAARGLPSARSR